MSEFCICSLPARSIVLTQCLVKKMPPLAETKQPADNELQEGSAGNCPQAPLRGTLQKGKRLRRVDLTSLNGSVKTHAIFLRKTLRSGRATREDDVRSRMITRHADLIDKVETQAALTAIRRELDAIKSRQLSAYVEVPRAGDMDAETTRDADASTALNTLPAREAFS